MISLKIKAGVWRFCVAMAFVGVSPAFAAPTKVDFNRDVRPILSNTCFVCHGPDEANRKAKLRMDVREDAVAHGAIVPGKSDESQAYRRITATDADEQMPPPAFHRPLTAPQIATLRQWIVEGAEYKTHWSYVKPVRVSPPVVKNSKWARNPIDNFVLARLEQDGIAPQPEADRYSLIRRVSLDLTGLPPTPAEADAFMADTAPDAYEKVVDRLLTSPSYGEHQARGWLDLARYADSAGYADDPSRTIWAYRDYVIRSFNANKPFDQFTIEQIAGDLLPNPSDDQLIATAFHRNTMTNSEGGTDDEEFRNAAIVDRVNTTMAVWMGTSMACAQCHTHKYDPISQTEYFRMFAFFNQSSDSDKKDETPLYSVLTDEQKTQQKAWKDEASALEKSLDTPAPAIVAAAQKWARESNVNLDWQALLPDKMQAQSGTALTSDKDTVAAQGSAKQDIFTLEAPLSGKLSALRLEALPDAALPGNGPGHANGNFVVTKVSATLLTPDAQAKPKARFVRIELPGKGKLLQLAEVQVFSGGENLALRGEARQSSTYADAEAKRAIDGNTAGEYEKGSVSHTGENDENPFWEVDLKTEAPIERVVIWNRAEVPERLQGFKIVALDDKRQTIWEKANNDATPGSMSLALGGGRDIRFVTAVADFTQNEFNAQDVLSVGDKADKTHGWAIGGAQGKTHWLSLLAESPFEAPPGSRLRVIIEQQSGFDNHTLGRFRLSSSADPRAGETLRTPPDILNLLAVPEAARDEAQKTRLASYYAREIAPEMKPIPPRIAMLQKQIADLKPVTVPIMRDLPQNQRRVSKIQMRGSYLQTGAEVSEGVPSAFNPLPQGMAPNRLALAKWLVDDANPLTARVVANRYWETIFGVGLVRTSEEFGAQGELPANPELLDWLATEIVRDKWDIKQFLKTLVTSAAYRQSSKVTPDLLEKDPDNRLISRGPRFRMSAEMVRDQALFVSGLLSNKMYGPPVRPIRPSMGLNAAFGGGLDWKTSDGEDRHRRAIYTEWRRTSPYPSLTTFDAPNREVCTLRRTPTNTPLQALVTLNDPVFVEAAQALARRMAANGNTPQERIAFGFRQCLTRPPHEREVQRLMQLHDESLAFFKANPDKAMDMATKPIGAAPQGADVADLAAWTTVGNVLLNLDETLMKR